MMDVNTLMSTGMLLTILGYVAYQLKSIPVAIWVWIRKKLTFQLTVYQTDELFIYLEKYFRHKYNSEYKNVEATLSSYKNNDDMYIPDSDKDKDKDQLYLWQDDDYFIIRHKKRRIIIDKRKEKLEQAQSLKNVFLNSYKISGLLAKNQILDLVNKIIEYNQQFKEKQLPRLYTNNSYGDWSYLQRLDKYTKTLNNVLINDKTLLINDINNFINNYEWYHERSIPYKRGYLFYGEPGNGKTSLSLALSLFLDRDIYILNLNSVDDDLKLTELFSQIQTKSIILLEDIDACFEKRENKEQTKISFSALLNCLDGVYAKEDVIVLMTTNHKEKLDPALIRAGRIDLKIEVSNPTKDIVEQYIDIFYNVKNTKLPNFKDKSISMVDIQNICIDNKNNINQTLKILQNE